MSVATKADAKSKKLEVGLGSFLTGIGAVTEALKETRARIDRVASTRFSVFWYFKRDESILSGIFADLLRPDGSHGQGATFLDDYRRRDDLVPCGHHP